MIILSDKIKASEITKEIVISKITGSSVMAKKITSEEISEIYEVVYKKIYELFSSVED